MIERITNSCTKLKEWRRAISSLFLTLWAARKRIVNALTVFVLFMGIAGFGACQHTRLARYMSIAYAVIAALGLQISLRSLPVGIFIAWTAFIFYVHPMTPVLAALSALIYVAGFLFVVRSPVSRRTVLNLVCIYAIVNVLWQLLQISGHTIWYNPIYSGAFTLVGLQTNVGETSVLMAVCLPAFFRRRWVWLLPIPLIGLVMARATVGMLALAVVGFVYTFSRIWKEQGRVSGLAALGILSAMLVSHVLIMDPFIWEQQKNSRLQTWKESVVIALGKPIRGQGFGQFCTMVPLLSTPLQLTVPDRLRLYDEIEDKKHFKDLAEKITGGDAASYYRNKRYPQSFFFEAHNEYVEVLFAAGIPGLILLLAGLAHILWRGWKQTDRRPFYGLLASCVGASVWFTWQIVPIAVITVVWAGLCLAGRNE